MNPTPVRSLGTADPAGYRFLSHTGSDYRDGGEAAVLELVRSATDLRSDSVEMVARAKGWAQRYHVDPARASVVRCLDLPADATVLEVGAGCGAISRYLGERCAVVDSLEPVPLRAAAAAARCRDLDSVRVLVGELADVPAEPTYDVVVVVGVLEYVGGGSDDREPYLDFLRQIRARLADGGTLVLAIENKLGVKYLVGAPEDHTNRAFDGPEGYPRGGKARTFSRRELAALMTAAGFADTAIRTAFPDYKIPRAIFGELPAAVESLAWRLPRFPSPDWRSKRPKLADEARVWRSLVSAGLTGEFGNSFLVLAGADRPSQLWPDGQLGMFWSTDRIAALNAQTQVTYDGTSARFIRTALRPPTDMYDAPAPGPTAAPPQAARLIESTTAFQPGTDLADVVAAGGPEALRPLAPGWLQLLQAALDGDPDSAVDVVPHNLIVDADNQLHVIDIELAYPASRENILRRGIFWLADRVAPLAPADRWPGCRTVGDVMRTLGTVVAHSAISDTELDAVVTDVFDPHGDWIGQAVAHEAALLEAVRPGPTEDRQAWAAQIAARTAARVDRTLASLPLGTRLPDTAARTAERLTAATTNLAAAKKELAAAERRRAAAEHKLTAARTALQQANNSRAVRLVRLPRRIARKLFRRPKRR